MDRTSGMCKTHQCERYLGIWEFFMLMGKSFIVTNGLILKTLVTLLDN